MSDEVAPEGLAAILADVGLRLGGPLGAGARGAVWAAGGPDGARWAVTVHAVRSATHGARLERRAAALAAVDHEHLARVAGAAPLPDGRLAVLHRAVTGTDVATMLAARPGWAPGEVVTVLVPLAGALAALHDAGLAHGDVAPANVVISDGRPVLVDLLTGDDPLELGTPGFAAPERAHGADAAGDVHALARLGLALLGDGPGEVAGVGAGSTAGDEGAGSVGRGREDGHGGDGGHSGDGGDARARAELAALLAAVCDASPAERVDAATLAAEIYAVCAAEPVRAVDPAVLARLSLRRLAGDGGVRTQPRTARVRGRHRRRRRRAPAAIAVAALVAVATTGTLVWPELAGAAGDPGDATTTGARAAADGDVDGGGSGGAAGATTDGAPGSSTDGRAASVVAPLDLPAPVAAVRLTRYRAAAILAGDAAALAAVTVPGSPASRADRRALPARGADAAATVADPTAVRTLVSELAPVRPRSSPWRAVRDVAGESCRDVRLVVALASAAADVVPDAAAPVRLTLCATAAGWRVADVAAG